MASRSNEPVNALDNPERDVTDYPKFKNDHGSLEIQIGVKEFKCIGVSAPHDHPHVYLNMGTADSIMCPYCSTQFRYTAGLGSGAIPVDSVVEADLYSTNRQERTTFGRRRGPASSWL